MCDSQFTGNVLKYFAINLAMINLLMLILNRRKEIKVQTVVCGS